MKLRFYTAMKLVADTFTLAMFVSSVILVYS